MERVRPALGEDATCPVDAGPICRADGYLVVADDGSAARAKREAGMLLSLAEGHLSAGMHQEGLEAASQAALLFKALEDEAGEADASSLIIDAEMQQAEVDTRQPTHALRLCLAKIEEFKGRGKKRGEMAMQLSVCSVYSSMKRSSRDLEEAASFGKTALQFFEDLGERRMIAAAHLALMNIYFRKGSPKETKSFAHKALGIYSEISDPRGEAKAYHGLAMASSLTDDMIEVISTARQALQIYQDLGDRGAQARELQFIAKWSLEKGNYSEALATAQESLIIWRNLAGCKQRECVALLLVCETLAMQGKGRQAVKLAKATLAKFEESGEERAVASALEVLLEAHIQADSPADALNAANEALAAARKLGDKYLQLHLLHQVCMIQRHSIEAGETMKQAARLAQELRDPDEEAQALLMFGYTQIQRFDIQSDKMAIQEALSLVSDARLLFQDRGDESREADCLMCLACLRSLNKDKDRVVQLAKEAQEMFGTNGNVHGEACAWRMITEVYLIDKRYDEALEAANSCVDVHRAAGQRRRLVDAMLKVASIHLDRDERYFALSIAEEAQGIIEQVGCRQSEAKILCLIAEIQLDAFACEEVPDSKSENRRLPGPFLEARAQAMKAVSKALMLAGQCKDENLRGTALFLRAQVLTHNNKGSEALRSAMEAEKVFAKVNAIQNQANAQILCAKLYHAFGDGAEAVRLARCAMNLVRQPGFEDPVTEFAAVDFLDVLEPISDETLQAEKTAAPDLTSSDSKSVGVGLDLGSVRSRLYDLIRNTIAGDEDIHADASLGDSGVDSLASVQLISNIGREFQVSLSPAAVFDYPTLRSLTQHVVEASRSI